MIRPPIVGPRIGASIAGTATTLMTLPILFGPAASAIISWPIGRIMPPPTPCRTRNTISSVVDVASPHSADPAVNSTSETRYTCLAPKRRAAHPVTGITAASASMYPVTTHWIWSIVECSSRLSVASATLTIVVSRIDMIDPTITTPLMSQTCALIGSPASSFRLIVLAFPLLPELIGAETLGPERSRVKRSLPANARPSIFIG